MGIRCEGESKGCAQRTGRTLFISRQQEDSVSESGTKDQPGDEPKEPQATDTKPEEDRPITEDADGTPKENPSGG
jgi:hypothetical protein